ncbi:hypothetical protein [Helcococcus massiliensis]|uniref:hypothetical protein n=1 Tax=Helcococcus massiliensis TaxID=2040290 RepID=UPI000CDE79C2|nr:hypothetical protein [Helcococcus massiliensis]
MKEKRNFYLILFILNICLIFAFNYLVLGAYYKYKYDLGTDYLQFTKTNKSKDSDFSFLLDYEDLSLVAETNKDDSVVALYDPSMYYYTSSSKIISPQDLRYFSKDDYINKKNVSMLLADLESIFNGKIDEKLHGFEDKYNTNIINVLADNSAIAIENKNLKLIKNLFSVNTSDIDHIYMRNHPKEKESDLISHFEQAGFKQNKDSLLQLLERFIVMNWNTSLYTRAILLSLGIIYMILIFFTEIYSRRLKKDVLISRIYGASLKDYINLHLKDHITKVFLGLLVSTILTIFYFEIIGNRQIKLDFIIVSFVSVLFITSFISIFKIIKYFKMKLPQRGEL